MRMSHVQLLRYHRIWGGLSVYGMKEFNIESEITDIEMNYSHHYTTQTSCIAV